MPDTLQFISTVDHAFSDNFATSVSAVATRSWHKENPFDTNLAWGNPAQPDGPPRSDLPSNSPVPVSQRRQLRRPRRLGPAPPPRGMAFRRQPDRGARVRSG